jgi:hypothetical protein
LIYGRSGFPSRRGYHQLAATLSSTRLEREIELDPLRELPYGLRHVTSRIRGRTHVSTRSVLFEKILVAPTGRPHMSMMTMSPFSYVRGIELSAIPEPSTWAMMALGFTALGYAACRRNAKARTGTMAV